MNIFITGGTGYIGSRLIKALVKNGNYQISALVRNGSQRKLPAGCNAIIGDALNAGTYIHSIKPATTFIHLVGVAHPSPAKKEQFYKIDLVSAQQAAIAAKAAGIEHFIYLSIAQYPTSIMKDYQEVRAEGEKLLLNTGIKSSFIRPWYVLGPGHWWPLLLKPFYLLAKLFPALKEKAEKLDTVTIQQMIQTLQSAIEYPPLQGCVYYEVRDIKLVGG